MRSRLAYTLSSWLLGVVALSVLAMGGLTAWNLREGFSAYLEARDLERLDKFVVLAGARLAQSQLSRAGTSHEPIDRPDMPALLHELAVLEGLVAPGAPPPRPRGKDAPRPPGPRDGGPPPRDGDDFGSRVSLARPDGRAWAGPPIKADQPGVIERPIRVDGAVVALARLWPMPSVPEAHETRFLRSQYIGIAVVALALLALALGCALWLARQWVRPLVAVQAATARISQGELGVRLPDERSDEIGDVVRNVNRMAESLQRMEGARRRWLADLSHELRTPLTVLRGNIEALVDGVRPLSVDAVSSLREDALRMSALVDDLHLLSMADLKALACRFTQADAVQLVRNGVERHQQLATDAGLTLLSEILPNESIAVVWDAGRVEQLLANLLHNSLRYTDSPGRIVLALASSQGRVHLSLDDTAPGVGVDDLPRVFDPLFRADAARSRHNGGSGLGMAICAAIVEQHGGTIQASPSRLGGLRIDVVMPCKAGAVGV